MAAPYFPVKHRISPFFIIKILPVLLLAGINILLAQDNNSRLTRNYNEKENVKYFPTDLSRNDILKGKAVKSLNPGKAFFKVTYSSSGKLLTIEFVPKDGPRETIVNQPDYGGENSNYVKIYPTDLSRGDILAGKTVKSMNRSKAYFKAVYSSAGKLIFVEYVSALKDRTFKKKEIAAKQKIKLYGNWNPGKRELGGLLTKKQARRRNHYRAVFDPPGQIKYVDYIKRGGKRLWTYYPLESENRKIPGYELKLNIGRPLTEFDQFLFSPKLSEARAGWRIRIILNEVLKPSRVQVIDNHGDTVYYYIIEYKTGLALSSYFRADSLFVGSHRIDYESGHKVSKITYFNSHGNMERAVAYEYLQESDEMIISRINSRGQVTERRRVGINSKNLFR